MLKLAFEYLQSLDAWELRADVRAKAPYALHTLERAGLVQTELLERVSRHRSLKPNKTRFPENRMARGSFFREVPGICRRLCFTAAGRRRERPSPGIRWITARGTGSSRGNWPGRGRAGGAGLHGRSGYGDLSGAGEADQRGGFSGGGARAGDRLRRVQFHSDGHGIGAKRPGIGADGILLSAPWYNRPKPEGIRAHFFQVADAGGLPVIAENIPSRTCVNISPALMGELARHPLIRGLKEASSDAAHISEMLAQVAGASPSMPATT